MQSLPGRSGGIHLYLLCSGCFGELNVNMMMMVFDSTNAKCKKNVFSMIETEFNANNY